jgi:phosphoribosylformimino-5-aminoimidazole carboxamide ribotide isomerase
MLIFPAIDLKDGKCVRLLQGKATEVTVYSDDPVAMALHWQEQGGQFLHIVDLDGAFSGEPKNWEWVSRIAAALKIPVQLGGGLRTIEQIRAALAMGVSRVVLGTKATSEAFMKEAFGCFDAEKLVVGIDARDGKVAVAGWTEQTELSAVEFAKKTFHMGAARVIFTDISTDGMLVGPPLKSIRKLCNAIPCSIIASGGVSTAADVGALRDLKLPNLEGVIIGKALYEKKFTLREVQGG